VQLRVTRSESSVSSVAQRLEVLLHQWPRADGSATERQAELQEKYAEAQRRHEALREAARSVPVDFDIEINPTTGEAVDDGEH
jgi:DNA-binding transcriptional regulator YbjK